MNTHNPNIRNALSYGQKTSSTENSISSCKQFYAAIDIAKLIFALFVVAIHTEPFGFSFLLDKGFSIITRMCVPFFFVSSSYLFFNRNGKPVKYAKRLLSLYLVWCMIYLTINLSTIRDMTILEIVSHYFWHGHDVLWYLLASILGFFITYGLSKTLNPKSVLVLGITFLLIGCIKSTYSPLFERLFSINILDFLGSRNGVFYAFPYYALGLVIAKKNLQTVPTKKDCCFGLAVCLCLLIVESAIFLLVFKTENTILWLTVFPLTYYLLILLKQINVTLPYNQAFLIRKLSILIYVIHPFFLRAFKNLNYFAYFFAVSLTTITVSLMIIHLSNKQHFKWLRVLF